MNEINQVSEIILASGSPRRLALMEQVGIPCRVVVSNADETISGEPDFQVRALALRKAEAVRGMIASDAVIIAADTLVYVDGKVLGKPETAQDAFDMLATLRGREHTVYTGVAVLTGTGSRVFVDSTKVYFRDMLDAELWEYIATGEPFDKAGAYGVQDRGALLVDRVEGDYFTVVGLPIAKVAVALRELGAI